MQKQATLPSRHFVTPGHIDQQALSLAISSEQPRRDQQCSASLTVTRLDYQFRAQRGSFKFQPGHFF
jgi:hypothetical protein